MELRQLRYFVRIVEMGSMSRAARELDVVQSALSQQITRLESELAVRLLQRTPRGVVPTEAGVAFFREAQLALRHADQAVRSARRSRLSGSVSLGLAPTTATILALPLMRAMRARYPDVRLHLVESMSGHLAEMLNARALDMAVLFDSRLHGSEGGQPRPGGRRWQVHPLIEEQLYLIRSLRHPQGGALPAAMALGDLAREPLILPTGQHGLRSTLDTAFAQARFTPHVVLEVDSLSMVMAAVDAGLGSTLQPWAAMSRFEDAAQRFDSALITDRDARRTNLLCTLSEDELSPAALAARVVLVDCVRELVSSGAWSGTTPIHHER
ncbi:LysR family transcriptional regulator [Comamonas endophytica]|uniref:LysR substrate-binding domain-containing protein n=1 Tax=Comamonas endophytica TaxID=2949090 RepID=A0ABY6GGU4_9BURK|nr:MULTISPECIES: LysR substrate-binding domain-containing protein [unclassified Acidovorax]MCD2514295.1 LysR substrate-binding domain-containing protein [Acidovorax sp. D4N7]UYG53545.1 LysR substrate-binding domain-containing protein [Acidovorax sp. 5MLIR]